MLSIHNYLARSVRLYDSWHKLKSHRFIHWSAFSFGALALFFLLTGAIISYNADISELAFLNRFIPSAHASSHPTPNVELLFDEGTGTSATNTGTSGAANNCSGISNFSWAEDPAASGNYALLRQSDTAIAPCGNVTLSGTVTQFSIGAWVNPVSSVQERLVLTSASEATPNSGSHAWMLRVRSDQGYAAFHMINTGGSSDIWQTNNGVIPNGSWSHILFVISGCSTTTSMDCSATAYINGQAVSLTKVADNAGSRRVDTSYTFVVGNAGTFTGSTLLNKIDKPQIWLGSVLNSTQAIAVYNEGRAAGSSSAPADWYSTSWQYRKAITLNSSQVSGSSALTNFPALISTTDLALRHTSSGGKVGQSNGNDLLFTDSSGTKLDHEIEKYVSSTGELIAWVKIPSLSASANTTIYLYYGNSSPANQANPTGVWSTSYTGVWHLGETVTDEQSIGTHLDSTSNANNGTQQGNVTATAKIGSGQSFDGTNDYISVNDSNSLDMTTGHTVSLWYNPAGFPSGANPDFLDMLISKNQDCGSGSVGNYGLEVRSTGSVNALNTTGTDCNTGRQKVNGTNSMQTGTWYYLTGTYDGTNLRLYFNGSQDGTPKTSSALTPNSNPVWFGRNNVSGFQYYAQGTMDEIRIANTPRSSDWIITEYNNQNSPSSFHTFGTEENSGVTPPPPSGDTTPPTVTITAPSAGSTLSGTVTLSASASDNVGVAGVQFKLDGSNIGSEDTSSPYSISWNSASMANGNYTLTAVARDAAGNSTTSGGVSVTVSNATGQGPVVSDVRIDQITKTSARVFWRTDVEGTGQAFFGETTSYGITSQFNSNRILRHQILIGGLKPNTMYQICPQSKDASNIASVCDGINNNYTFTTLADTNNGAPEEPIAPEEFDTSMQTQTGTVLSVSVTNNCNDPVTGLQARINEAAVGSGPYTIMIPAGAVCTDSYKLPARPANETGWIVIRTSTPDSQLPPPGTRIKPEQKNLMATVRNNVLGPARPGAVTNGCNNASVHLGSIISSSSNTPGMEILYRCVSVSPQVTEALPYTTGIAVPSTCNVGEMFYKTDAPKDFFNNLVDHMYLCIAQNEFVPVDNRTGIASENDGAFVAVENAHHYRIIGLEITHVPQVYNDHQSLRDSPYANENGTWAGILFNSNQRSHHIIIDRSYVHGYDYPYRLALSVALNGDYTAVVDSYIEKNSLWNGWFRVGGAVDFHHGGPKKIQNNYLASAGIDTYVGEPSDGGTNLVHDVVIRSNHYDKPTRYKKGTPESDGFHYSGRHLVEFKHGSRVLVEGNIFENNWSYVNQAASVVFFSPTAFTSVPFTAEHGVKDINITNNIFKKTPYGILIVGNVNEHTANRSVSHIMQRVKIHNNLAYDFDGFIWDAGGLNGDGRGTFIGTFHGVEDQIITHNTVYNSRGTNPEILTISSTRRKHSGLLVRDNVFSFNQNGGIGGTGGGPIGILDTNWKRGDDPDWVFNNNVIVPGSGVSINQSLYPPANLWPSSESAVGFTNPVAKNFELLSSSPYKGAASDGTDIGVNWAQLVAATQNTESGVGGGLPPPPSGDTTAPTVSITTPAPSATLSGTVSLTATASDNVGVVGVQFKLNGNNIGLEDTNAPYSLSWDSTTVANGTHTLTAIARDAAGNVTTSASVSITVNNVVDTTPPTISNTTVTNLTQTSATITWTTDEQATSQVQYGQTTSYGSMTNLDSSLLTAHSVTLTSLSAGTTYNYRVRSKDAANNEAVGINRTFTTVAAPDTTSPAAVADLSGINITQTSVELTWTAPGDDNTTGTASSYDIRFSTSVINAASFSTTQTVTGEPNPAIAGTIQRYTLVGLSPGTTYTVALKTADEVPNVSALSNVVTFTTAAPAPDTTPPQISNIQVSSISQNSATITWSTDELATTQVQYGPTTSYGLQNTPDALQHTSHSATLTNLSSNSLIHFRAVSRDAAGNTAFSSNQTFTTAPAPAGSAPVISNVAISSISQNSATITWSTDKLASSRLNYGLIDTLGFATVEANLSPRVTDHSVTLANLVSCARYRYRVVSKDSSDNATNGAIGVFATRGCIGEADILDEATKLINVPTPDALSLATNNRTVLNVSTPSSFASLAQAFLQTKRLDRTKALSVLGHPAGKQLASLHVYDLTMHQSPTSTIVSFQNPLTITMTYTDADISGLDANTLVIFRHNGTVWQELANCSRNTAQKQVSCPTTSFSLFALGGATPPPGSSGSGSGGGGVAPDTTPPPEVSNATAQGADNQVVLTWQNPTSDDYVRTIVVRSTASQPGSINDGEIIYEGIDEIFVDVDVANATIYYYSIFTIDRVPNYSLAVSLQSSPIEGKEQITVTPPSLSGPGTSFGSGRLIKYPNNPTIYLLQDGIKYPIPSYAIYLARFGAARPIAVIPETEVYPDGEALRFGPGALIKTPSAATVWLIVEDGSRYPFKSAQEFFSFGFRFDLIETITEAELEAYPLATFDYLGLFHASGTFVKYASNPTVYRVNQRIKYPITSPAVFFSYANSFQRILIIPDNITYPDGSALSFPDGVLIKGSGETVYLVEGGARRAIGSADAFFNLGYSFDQVREVGDGDLLLNNSGSDLFD